jgi:LL-diaminopimelate aminotransferase
MFSNRVDDIEEYCFEVINKIKCEKIQKGDSVLDLGIGDPDLYPHKSIQEELIRALNQKGYNKYPPYEGIEELKMEIIKYYDKIYSVKLSLDEVLILIGSKEGISHALPVICDAGEEIIITEPKYPPYESSASLWGIKCNKVRLHEKNNFLLDLSDITNKVSMNSKLMILNYPNNPTGAVANEYFYKQVIRFCKKNSILLCNDGAYNEIVSSNVKPNSILSYDEEKYCFEFGTFSKTFSMTGFRIGFVVGNKNFIKGLLKIKTSFDSGQFTPIQYAAIAALKVPRSYINNNMNIYEKRKNVVKKIFKEKNIRYFNGKGTFYLWCHTPMGYNDRTFAQEMLEKYSVIITPGSSFGKYYDNYFRISITSDEETIKRVLGSIREY